MPTTAHRCVRRVPTPEPSVKRRGPAPRYTLAVHGGAGVVDRARMTRARHHAYDTAIRAALGAGHGVLNDGGTSVDAVVAAVAVLEDSPLFNAGRGAAFTADGTIELDAAVMDGATHRAGAVTLITTVRNPVKLARIVMDETRHVLLASRGAEKLAREHGLEVVPREYFHTRRRWEALQRVKRQAARHRLTEADRHGTVGAVALDAHGSLAAATSTGGYTNKLVGRIGDSPIIGAGTYASNFSAAVSCTGEGEHFMRGALAHTLSMLMELKRWSVTRAAKHVIHSILTRRGGTGGLIALDRGGRVAMPFNTPGMYRGVIRAKGAPVVRIYQDSEPFR